MRALGAGVDQEAVGQVRQVLGGGAEGQDVDGEGGDDLDQAREVAGKAFLAGGLLQAVGQQGQGEGGGGRADT